MCRFCRVGIIIIMHELTIFHLDWYKRINNQGHFHTRTCIIISKTYLCISKNVTFCFKISYALIYFEFKKKQENLIYQAENIFVFMLKSHWIFETCHASLEIRKCFNIWDKNDILYHNFPIPLCIISWYASSLTFYV